MLNSSSADRLFLEHDMSQEERNRMQEATRICNEGGFAAAVEFLYGPVKISKSSRRIRRS